MPAESTNSQSPITYQQSDRRSGYVLVTPVRNEEKFISRTINSVINQTILPREWIIVSDGSTDATDTIVANYLAKHTWIRLIKLPKRKYPCFAAVVENTTLGINSLQTNDYQYLGLLDSDLEFQADYFEKLIGEFHQDSKLGLAGGVAIDIGHSKEVLPRNKQDVPGALQFFRRECFEAIGGLTRIPEGGWDSITCTTARMKGFKTRLVTHLIVDHLKPRNTICGGVLRRKWQLGVRDYALGYHPIFEFVKCSGRLFRDKPYIVSSIVWISGFLYSSIANRKRLISSDFIQHVRSEQMKRLTNRGTFSRNLKL